MQKNLSKRLQDNVVAYLFLAPFLLVFAIFLAYPLFYSFWLSFRQSTLYIDWYHVFTDMEFSGFQNYTSLLADKNFWGCLLITGCYGLLTIPTSIAASLGLAVLLNMPLKGRDLYRTGFFLPNMLDLFVIGTVWVLIFSPRYGFLDIVLNQFGITFFSEHSILGTWYTCLPAIALAMVLKGAGFGMILFLAAMQNIPSSLYEAASIDGATRWQQFRHITIPLVKPIILFMIITGTISCLTAFTEVYAMTNNTGGPSVQLWGEPLKAANLAGYYLYRSFIDGFYGKAAAISFVMLFIALGISVVHMKLLKSE